MSTALATKQLTIEQFSTVMPKQLRKTVTQEMVDDINRLMTDPLLQQTYRDNLLSYVNVMKDGKFKVQQYIDAVRYICFKLSGDSNLQAYIKTFPDRYQAYLANNTQKKDINSYVTSYNKNKLVNLIYEQTLVPTHVLNADIYQKAINTQADLMVTAKSEKVRSDAANSLLHHLKAPETKKIELDVTQKESSAIAELRNTTMELVAQQKRMIAAGASSVKEVAEGRLIAETGEVIDE